jgi:hypothetical protein
MVHILGLAHLHHEDANAKSVLPASHVCMLFGVVRARAIAELVLALSIFTCADRFCCSSRPCTQPNYVSATGNTVVHTRASIMFRCAPSGMRYGSTVCLPAARSPGTAPRTLRALLAAHSCQQGGPACCCLQGLLQNNNSW